MTIKKHETLSMADLFSHSPHELSFMISKYTAPLVAVEPDDLNKYLIALVNSINKNENPDPFDSMEATRVLSSEKKANIFTAAVKGLHTHNLKVPNAGVCQVSSVVKVGSAVSDPASLINYVSGETVNCEKTYGSVGNRAYSFYFLFLAKEFIYKGEKVCIGVELMNINSNVTIALMSLGLPQAFVESLGLLLSKRLTTIDDNSVDRLLEQAVFPCENDSCVVISPVQNTAFANEFHNRLWAIKKKYGKKAFIPKRPTAIGGPNGVNAGQFNAEVAGMQQHLLAMAPVFELKTTQRLLCQLKKTRSLFSGVESVLSGFSALERAQNYWRNNGKARDRIKLAVDGVVDEYMMSIKILSWHVSDQDEAYLEQELDFLSFSEKRLLDARFRQGKKLAHNEVEYLAGKAMSSIRSRAGDFVIDDTVDGYLKKALSRRLRGVL